jgi:hypothetical protein
MFYSQVRHLGAMIELLPTLKWEKTKKNVTTIEFDIAKRVFHFNCCHQLGQLIKKRMLRRAEVHSSLIASTLLHGFGSL